ncbi:hypothetical protein EJ110_NYTH43883 [Nymphaea thermarum]|nr:hypothetical protein EJ110_NYTH43883 [Nymphaea thermarum]
MGLVELHDGFERLLLTRGGDVESLNSRRRRTDRSFALQLLRGDCLQAGTGDLAIVEGEADGCSGPLAQQALPMMGEPGDSREPMVLGGAEEVVAGREDVASSSSTTKARSWAAILDYNFIFMSLRSLWSGITDLRFTSVGKCMFILRTSSEEDLKHIMLPGRWYVGGRPLIANQWHPGMPMRIESFN